MVDYLEDHYTNYLVNIDPPKRLPRVRLDGYGHKIPTSYVVAFSDTKRKYRVYATCWSNVASFWITRDRAVYHLQSWDFVRSNDISALERELEAQAEALIS